MKIAKCLLILLFPMLSYSQSRDTSNILQPANIFHFEKIIKDRTLVEKLDIDTLFRHNDSISMYIVEDGNHFMVYMYNDSLNEEYIQSIGYTLETDYPIEYSSGNLHGLFYHKKGDWETIELYETDTLIGHIQLFKSKPVLKEFVRNGNMFFERVYDERGIIKGEKIGCTECDLDKNEKRIDCANYRFFKVKQGVTSVKGKPKITCSYSDLDFYSYLNYPTLHWFKDLTGIEWK